MITVKQWKKFKEYRMELFYKWITSKEYEELEERRQKLFEPIENKFLWFKWKTSHSPLWVILEMGNIDLLEIRQKPYIPPETVEGCLDWLASDKKGQGR